MIASTVSSKVLQSMAAKEGFTFFVSPTSLRSDGCVRSPVGWLLCGFVLGPLRVVSCVVAVASQPCNRARFIVGSSALTLHFVRLDADLGGLFSWSLTGHADRVQVDGQQGGGHPAARVRPFVCLVFCCDSFGAAFLAVPSGLPCSSCRGLCLVCFAAVLPSDGSILSVRHLLNAAECS